MEIILALLQTWNVAAQFGCGWLLAMAWRISTLRSSTHLLYFGWIEVFLSVCS